MRERVRTELVEEIKRLGREQLAAEGATALSLRAIARQLGMVSSAIYRYVPSRDALLTMLIVDAYEALGDAVDAAERRAPRDDLAARWRAICRAVRRWAHAHPAEYALIYGTPVPGYEAPEDTVDPATRVASAMLSVLTDAWRSGRPVPSDEPALAPSVARDLRELAARLGADVPPAPLARGLQAWTMIFGTVSFELFGHYHHVIDHLDVWFDDVIDRTGASVGLV